MTSPLRKKRQITPPSFRPTNNEMRGARSEERGRRLRFSATVALAVVAIACSVQAEPIKLQWGADKTPVKKESSPKTALKFVKPGVYTAPVEKRVAVIKLAAWESADAPRLTSGREENTRSVVVSREEGNAEGFRSAQLPTTGGATAQPAQPSTDDSLRSPFADTPEETPKLETPNFESPAKSMNENAAQPRGNSKLPPPRSNNTNQDNDQLGQELPSGLQNNDAGQFQPVLPAGPGPDQSPPMTNTDSGTIQAEGEKAKESCEKSLENLRAYTVDKVKLDIAIVGTEGEDFPFECSINDGQMFAGRCWDQTTYMWKASAMCHKPLYFEEEQLERYGHSFSPAFQPFVSGAHFFVTLPVLPYCMGVEPPCECIYALGHYRPGSCAPYMINPVPLSARGALIEAGAVTGAAAALP